jgi:signal recognition particle subunit SRP54
MFDRLSEGFSSALKKISGRGSITEANIREAVEEVRTALLDADVNYDVVKQFCDEVVEEAVGSRVTKSLKPGQEFIGVVHRRLVELIGGEGDEAAAGVMKVSPGPTVVMMCGLQGSGKTTTCGKLAGYLKKRGRSVMLVAADLQRPAAVEQLETVARQANDDVRGSAKVMFYSEPDKVAEYGKAVGVAVQVCQRAVEEARRQGIDTVILDTAGRLHVNDDLMDELHRVNRLLTPHQIFLVVDAMIGQDAVQSAKAFHERLEVDGVILTKFDSDTRGGAALSVRQVTGAPIRFVGTGEKLDELEEFHADRVANRILGMGDVVSLVEKAQEEVSEEEAMALQEKMARGEMTMDDFLKQLRSVRRMGPMKQLLGLLPGVGQALKDVQVDDKQFDRIEGMINSMTVRERKDIGVMNASRRRRIATGSGVAQHEVGKLVKQFETVTKLSKQMAGMSGGRMKALQQLQGAAAGAGGAPGAGSGMAGFKGRVGTKSRSPKGRFKNKKRKRR